MKITELKVLRGPNFWSVKKHKLIQLLVDLDEFRNLQTNEISDFYERLKSLMPTLYNHSCVEGAPGGIFKIIREGTSLAHVVEHIALELQELAGMCTRFGRTRSTDKDGLYQVVFQYCEEEEGIYTARAAVRITEALAR